ncbi:MAG: acyltransferase [Firmicutes bacterium]|nr:acyltransferase [Bacillota bacterium]
MLQNLRTGFICEAAWLRAIACLNVIVIHVIAKPLYDLNHDMNLLNLYGAFTQHQYLVSFEFTRFAVPSFIFLTGFTLAWKYARSQDRFDFGSYIRHRFMIVFVPYALWSLLYSTYSVFYVESGIPAQAGLLALVVRYGHDLLIGDALYHMYFVVITLQFYLIAPLFILLAKRYVNTPAWLVFGLVYQVAVGLIYAYYLSPTGHPFWDAVYLRLDRNSLMWVGYFVIGLAVGRDYERIREWVRRFGGYFSIPWLLLFYTLIWEFYHAADLGYYNLGVVSTSNILYTLFFLPLIFWVGIKLSTTRANPVMLNLSDHSYGIFLAHPIIIGYLQPRFLWVDNLYNFGATMLLFALSIAIPWGFLLGYGRLSSRRRRGTASQTEAAESRSFQNPG